MGDDSSGNLGEQCMANIHTMVQGAEYKDCTTKQKRLEEAPSAPRPTGQPYGILLGENRGTIASPKT